MGYLTEDLINSVKIRTFAPISQNTLTDADLLTIANEELSLRLVSDILGVREDFFLTNETVAIVANEDHYAIPTRAIGSALKAVFYVDAGGNKTIIPRIEVDRSQTTSDSSGEPQKYYLEGDEIVLLPTPSLSSGSLLFSYFQRPNELVETASCAKITGSSELSGTVTFTVDTDLTTTLLVGDTVDFLNGSPPFLLWAKDVAVTAVTATTIDVALADVDDVQGAVLPLTGDYICLSGTANIPMVPVEFHAVLAQMTACRVLLALGHAEKMQMAKAELEQMRREALKLVKNRVELSALKVTGRSGLVKIFTS